MERRGKEENPLLLAGLQPGTMCPVTQERLAHRTGVSRGTVQTALKGLTRKNLLKVTAQGPKTPSLIRVQLPEGAGGDLPLWVRTLARPPQPKRRRLQDVLDQEDRALLDALLEGLSRDERAELEREAVVLLAEENPVAQDDPEEIEATVAELVLHRGFGPARLAKYRGKLEEQAV